MRNSKAFQQALADTVEQLAQLEVREVDRDALAGAIERRLVEVSARLGIQPSSALRYFDAGQFARTLAEQAGSGPRTEVGAPPMPPPDNPEMAVLIGGFLEALAGGGSLHTAVVNLAANAWMAGHVHGEDGCPGCQARGAGGHDYSARMGAIRQNLPDYAKWFDPAVFDARLAETGWHLTRRPGGGPPAF